MYATLIKFQNIYTIFGKIRVRVITPVCQWHSVTISVTNFVWFTNRKINLKLYWHTYAFNACKVVKIVQFIYLCIYLYWPSALLCCHKRNRFESSGHTRPYGCLCLINGSMPSLIKVLTDSARRYPGPRLNIKTVLSTYGDFHVKDKTAVRTSYL